MGSGKAATQFMTSPSDQRYNIQLTPLALTMLAEVKDQREQQALRERIDKLQQDPKAGQSTRR